MTQKINTMNKMACRFVELYNINWSWFFSKFFSPSMWTPRIFPSLSFSVHGIISIAGKLPLCYVNLNKVTSYLIILYIFLFFPHIISFHNIFKAIDNRLNFFPQNILWKLIWGVSIKDLRIKNWVWVLAYFIFSRIQWNFFFQLSIYRLISMLWIFAALIIIFLINFLCEYPISATSAVIVLLTCS